MRVAPAKNASCSRCIAGVHLIAVDDEREVDAGRAQRHHVHAHVAERGERARHRRACVAEARADERDDAAIALDRHVAERAQVDEQRLEVRRRRRS